MDGAPDGPNGRRCVGVDAGMHTLLRPALYGAYHHVVDLTQLDAPATHTATVVGPICETGDVLARDRRLPEVRDFADGERLRLAFDPRYVHLFDPTTRLRID